MNASFPAFPESPTRARTGQDPDTEAVIPSEIPAPLGLGDAEPGLWIVVDAEGDPFLVREDATGLNWVAAGHSERDLGGAIGCFNPARDPIAPGRFGMTTERSLVASIASVPDRSVAGFMVFDEAGKEIRREQVPA